MMKLLVGISMFLWSAIVLATPNPTNQLIIINNSPETMGAYIDGSSTAHFMDIPPGGSGTITDDQLNNLCQTHIEPGNHCWVDIFSGSVPLQNHLIGRAIFYNNKIQWSVVDYQQPSPKPKYNSSLANDIVTISQLLN